MGTIFFTQLPFCIVFRSNVNLRKLFLQWIFFILMVDSKVYSFWFMWVYSHKKYWFSVFPKRYFYVNQFSLVFIPTFHILLAGNVWNSYSMLTKHLKEQFRLFIRHFLEEFTRFPIEQFLWIEKQPPVPGSENY